MKPATPTEVMPAPGRQLITAYREEAAMHAAHSADLEARGYTTGAEKHRRAAERLSRMADRMEAAQQARSS